MFHVTNLVCSCCLLLTDTWSLLISPTAHHLPKGTQLKFKHSKILNMSKTYHSPLQIFRVSLITHRTRCFVISKLGTDFISHGGRASFYHLSCFWNPSFPVQTAPIMFLSLFTTEFLLLCHRSGRHLWEWEGGTSTNGEDHSAVWYATDGIDMHEITYSIFLL